MTDDGPEDLTLRLLRRMDEKLDRVIADVTDLKHRMTAVEVQVGQLVTAVGRVNERLDRIERRLDLVETPQG